MWWDQEWSVAASCYPLVKWVLCRKPRHAAHVANGKKEEEKESCRGSDLQFPLQRSYHMPGTELGSKHKKDFDSP